MSGQHVSDMAMSFVEMAKAFEELPKVKAELAEANRAFNHATDTIQRLELKLIDRNTTIDELHAKIREAEVARDDAELRFLEADEKLGHVAKALQAAGESVGLALRKPESAVVEPAGVPAAGLLYETVGQSVADPIEEGGTTSEKPYSEPSMAHQSPSESTSLSPDETPPTGSLSLQAVPPEPFSPESKPTDPVEVREETNPSVASVEGASTEASTATVQAVAEPLGQSDPLPTVVSPIDGLTAENTNASPSDDASSQTDEIDAVSYANEPQDKWTSAWSEWAIKMDRKHGRYNWPIRTAQA